MLKKVLRYIFGIGFILFIYFNYIKEPEKFVPKKEDKLVTTGVSYDVENYHIEAEKQVDNTADNTRSLEKAIAQFDEMKLSGDHALMDASKNFFAEDNILGIANNGWTIEANKANYNQADGKIRATEKVKAENKEEGMTIYGDTLISDTKLEDLNLKDNVRVVTPKLQMDANYAHYNNTTKILNVKEDIKIKATKLGALQSSVLSGVFDEIEYDGIKKTVHSKGDFTLYYGGVNLQAKQFFLDQKTTNFTITEDVVLGFDTGRLTLQKINYISKDNKAYFIGPIHGMYEGYILDAKKGHYDIEKGIVEISDNIKLHNETKTMTADKGIYEVSSGDLKMTSKTLVKYRDLDKVVTTKNFTYNNKTKKLKLLNGYDYKGKDYSSKGKELYYDENTKKGNIVAGNFVSNGISGKANDIKFDLGTKLYDFSGNSRVTYNGSILTSKKIHIDDNTKIATIEGNYKIYNPKDKVTFYGKNATYNMETGDLLSPGKIRVVQETKTMTGINLTYNSNTGLGDIERNIVIVDKSGTRLVGDRGHFNRDKYAELIGHLTVKTKDAILYANRGKYLFEDATVTIPGKITIKNKDGKATMLDGVYFMKKKYLKATKFVGKSLDKTAIGDRVNYYLDRKVADLEGNVKITNIDMKFVGSKVEYSFASENITSNEKYKLYYSNYIIDGKTLSGNLGNKRFHGTKIVMNSTTGEKLSGDFIVGDFKNNQIDLNGHVKILAFNIDKKTGKKEPVNIKSKTAKLFLTKDKEGKTRVSRAELKKDGIYKYQDMILYSDYIEIDLIKNLMLGKNGIHMIVQGKSDVKSEIAAVDMNTEIINLINRVKFTNKNEKGETITGTSKKGTIFNKKRVIILENNVIIDTNENHVEADHVDYNMDTGILHAKGNVRMDYK